MIQYDKLVRDLIPEIIAATKKTADIEIVNNEAIIYTNEELEKLHFELDEKARKPTSEKLIRCYECGDLDCIHRNAFRRVPKSEGGLGECPRLKKWLMENK